MSFPPRKSRTRLRAGPLLLLCLAALGTATSFGPAWAETVETKALPTDGSSQRQAKFEILFAAGLYTKWPATAERNDSAGHGVIDLGIVGNQPFGDELDRFVKSKRVGGRQIVVRQFGSSSEVTPCQILYITSDVPPRERHELIARLHGSPVLLVGETPDFCREGGAIGLHADGEHVRFFVNPQALHKQKLVMDPRFARLARPLGKPSSEPGKANAPAGKPVFSANQKSLHGSRPSLSEGAGLPANLHASPARRPPHVEKRP